MPAYSTRTIAILLLFVTACKSPRPKRNDEPVNKDAGVARVSMIRHNFLDSVAAGDELSFEQIAKHTIIDSAYRTEDARFTGDTLYRAYNKYPVGIISYSDGKACNSKFLLVFKPGGVNADYTEVEIVCEQEEGASNKRLAFKVLSDTSFYTREQLYKKLPDDSVKTTVIIRHYIINNEGMLEAVKEEAER